MRLNNWSACTGARACAGEGLITVSGALKPTVLASEGDPTQADVVILNLPCLKIGSAMYVQEALLN